LYAVGRGPLTPLPLRWLWTGSGSQSDQRAGAPVYKTCERCSGNGFQRAVCDAHRAILKLFRICTSEWSRNWKPFYDALVDMLERERQADRISEGDQLLSDQTYGDNFLHDRVDFA
jgi:hypothetical protein